jgi:Putative Flp pilus-assembly TadE/G-like
MVARTQLQNAADAAALAGASAIDTRTGVILPDSALARAQAISMLNLALIKDSQPVVLDAGDVQVLGGNRVRVTVRREGANAVVTEFARVFGIASLEMNADATAIVEPTQTATCGVVPLAAIPTGTPFLPGCEQSYALKTPGGAGANGNYNALQIPPCGQGECLNNGASGFKCMLQHGSCCPIAIGQQLQTQTGNMSGPTTSAIKYRFDNDVDSREGICHSSYTGNGQRVVLVPITTPIGNGTNWVTVTGFASFFISTIPDNGNDNLITGEFLDLVVPGIGGPSAPGAAAYSLRLSE